jgi:hypothetical protein
VTLDELCRTLPNGFHDAYLCRLSIDYTEGTVTLDLDLSYGDPDADTEGEREAYRCGQVVIAGLVWCVMEPPRTPGAKRSADGSRIDAGPLSTLNDPPELLPVPPGAFSWWFYLDDTNSFIYVAATGATLRLHP